VATSSALSIQQLTHPVGQHVVRLGATVRDHLIVKLPR
jgi:hypothetical protein